MQVKNVKSGLSKDLTMPPESHRIKSKLKLCCKLKKSAYGWILFIHIFCITVSVDSDKRDNIQKSKSTTEF